MRAFDVSEGEDVTYFQGSVNDHTSAAHMPAPKLGPLGQPTPQGDAALEQARALLAARNAARR